MAAWIQDHPVYSQQCVGEWALRETSDLLAGFLSLALRAAWTQLALLSCGARCRQGGRGSGAVKDKGTCQQVLHPAVLGAWRASRSFLAFGSEVGKASWLQRGL